MFSKMLQYNFLLSIISIVSNKHSTNFPDRLCKEITFLPKSSFRSLKMHRNYKKIVVNNISKYNK